VWGSQCKLLGNNLQQVQRLWFRGIIRFQLGSVGFADVTGQGEDDAVVVLHFDIQQTDYVYIYTVAAGRPKLLVYFHADNRAYSGLHKVYGQRGKLVVELFDPGKTSRRLLLLGYCSHRGTNSRKDVLSHLERAKSQNQS
jgi:hypothetical protein